MFARLAEPELRKSRNSNTMFEFLRNYLYKKLCSDSNRRFESLHIYREETITSADNGGEFGGELSLPSDVLYASHPKT